MVERCSNPAGPREGGNKMSEGHKCRNCDKIFGDYKEFKNHIRACRSIPVLYGLSNEGPR